MLLAYFSLSLRPLGRDNEYLTFELSLLQGKVAPPGQRGIMSFFTKK